MNTFYFIQYYLNKIKKIRNEHNYFPHFKETTIINHYLPIIKDIESFCDLSILHPSYIHTQSYKIKTQQIDLHILSYKKKSTKKYNKMATLIYSAISLLLDEKTKGCSDSLAIYIFLSPTKKKLNKNLNDVIGKQNVNSGFTFSCKIDGQNKVVIFREEEWFKVLIHELFHSFGIDFSHMNDLIQQSNEKTLNYFNVKSKVNLFEAYTETLSEIIFLFFVTLENKKSSQSIHTRKTRKKGKTISISTRCIDEKPDQDVILFKKLLKEQQRFSCEQSIKILDFMGLEIEDIFYEEGCTLANQECAYTASKEKYKEDSNILSYFIIKSIFLFHFDAFIECLSVQRTETMAFLRYDKSKNAIDCMIGLLDKKTNDTFFEEMYVIKSKIKSQNNSLRMTIHDI